MESELDILLALFPEAVFTHQTAHSVDVSVPLSVPPNPARALLLFSLTLAPTSASVVVGRVSVERLFGLDDSTSRTFVARVAESAGDLPEEGGAAALAASALEALREAGDRAVCVVCLDGGCASAADASLLQCGHGPVHALCLSRWWSTLSEAREAAPEAARVRQAAAQAHAAARARAADEARAALVAAEAVRAAEARCVQLSTWLAAAEAAARGPSASAGAPALMGAAARRARKEATKSADSDEAALTAAELASLLRAASSLRDRAVADAAAAAARSARTEAVADSAGGADGEHTVSRAATTDVGVQFPCPVCRAAVPTPLGVKIGAEFLPSTSEDAVASTSLVDGLPNDVLSYVASARLKINAVYERQRERGGLVNSNS